MSADDNAPEQAREVEVVARVVRSVPLGPLGPVALSIAGTDTFLANYSEAEAIAEAVLAALAPLRAAERQEAAREALLTFAARRFEMSQAWGHDAAWLTTGTKVAELVAYWVTEEAEQYRADGVTGRSGT